MSACRSLLRSQFCELLVNQRTSDTKTALHLATIGGYLEVVFELAQAKGFAADISDKEGRYLLWLIVCNLEAKFIANVASLDQGNFVHLTSRHL